MLDSILAKLQRRAARLGDRLDDLEQLPGGVAQRASRLPPPASDFELGLRAMDARLFELAITRFKSHLAASKLDARAWVNIGICLEETGDPENAESAYRKATESDLNNAQAWFNLGLILSESADPAIPAHCFEQVLRINPADDRAKLQLALKRFLLGDYVSGFELFESRHGSQEQFGSLVPGTPLWRGESLERKSICVWFDWGGLGDALQFVRFAPLLKTRLKALRVVVATSSELVRITRTMSYIDDVVPPGEFPSTDYQIPMLSLPRLLHIEPELAGATVPYFNIPESEKIRWQSFARQGKETLTVGIVWASGFWGNDHALDRIRLSKSVPWAQFKNVLDNPKVKFVSLQLGKGQEEFDGDPTQKNTNLLEIATEISDFFDTASAIDQLDLVISVDTSVAHLAGALGKPCWMLLRKASGNFWFTDRVDSPWYPHMRLFRQKEQGRWDDVLDLVGRELAAFAEMQSPRNRD